MAEEAGISKTSGHRYFKMLTNAFFIEELWDCNPAIDRDTAAESPPSISVSCIETRHAS